MIMVLRAAPLHSSARIHLVLGHREAGSDADGQSCLSARQITRVIQSLLRLAGLDWTAPNAVY